MLVAALAVLLALSWSHSGGGAPQIGYVYPAGGQRGTTFLVEVGGQRLRDADGVRISGKGVHATVTQYAPELNNQDRNKVQRFMNDLVKRRWSASAIAEAAKRKSDEPPLPDHPWLRGLDDRRPEELDRLRVRLFDPKRQPNAQLRDQITLQVTIAPDAPVGDRELRISAPDGLSPPLCFQVGMLREACEEAFTGGAKAQVLDLPMLLNGQITPGETDHIRLRARSGQKLVIRLHARRLIPYLADAVPGWFQATMALHGPDGREVAWSDDHHFDPDPAILYQVPADGVYELRVRDAIYRGREDFVYRIAMGELPFATQIFPLGAREGADVKASVQGWNLGETALKLDTRPGQPAIRRGMTGADQGLCSSLPYLVDALSDVAEKEPNNIADEAHAVTFPLAINGHIGAPGDVDVFQFQGKAGQTVVAETYARRLGSPLDSALRLVDSAGIQVAFNDDHKDRTMGLLTHQADSYVQAELPRDGTYRLVLSDVQRNGSEAHAYRLQIRLAQPDVALRVVPSCINARAGGSAKITIHALRKDGFDGPVDVALADAPDGFALRAARIPAGETSVETTVSAPRSGFRQVVPVRIEGRAEIAGETVRRPAAGAEDMMQAFLWRFLVPRQELLVAVTGSRPVPTVWRPLVPGVRLAQSTPVHIPLGGTAQVRIEAPLTLPDAGKTALSSVQFRLSNQPRGVTLEDASVGPKGIALTLKADPNTALAGDKANAIIEAAAAPSGKSESPLALGVLPAIQFEIVRP